MRSTWVLAVASVLAVGAADLGAAAPLSGASAQSVGPVGVSGPAENFVVFERATELTSNLSSVAEAEALFTPSGDLMLKHWEGAGRMGLGRVTWPNISYAVVNGNVTATATPVISGYSIPGDSMLVDRQGRLTVLYNAPNYTSYYRHYALNGTPLDNASRVGGYASPSVDVGLSMAEGSDGSLHFTRSVYINVSSARITYDAWSASGTRLAADVSLGTNAVPGMGVLTLADPTRSRVLQVFPANNGHVRVYSRSQAGVLQWGPTQVATNGRAAGAAVGPDGRLALAWGDGADLSAAVLGVDGAVDLGPAVLATNRSYARQARPLWWEGQLLVAWVGDGPSGISNIHVVEADGTTLGVIGGPLHITQTPDYEWQPRLAVGPDGTVALCWLETAAWCGRLFHDRSGFEADTPEGDLVALRGERMAFDARVTSRANYTAAYAITPSVTGAAGAGNWTVELFDPVTGQPAGPLALGPGGNRSVRVQVRAPVADPPGYAATVSLLVEDQKYPGVAAALGVRVTVNQGHRLALTPDGRNATALPGEDAVFPFTLSNVGLLDEAGLEAALAPQLPGGWNATLAPAVADLVPGASANFTLRVRPPANASSTDRYCARVRFDHAVDPFATVSAGFCVAVALVAQPLLEGGTASLLLDSGGSAPARWTLTNAGNAGASIPCGVAIREALPEGWTAAGNPASMALLGGQAQAATFTIAAPSGARGGTVLNLTVEGTCEGSAARATLPLQVTVNTVHAIAVRAGGLSFALDEKGEARLDLTAPNAGNVGEALQVQVEGSPPNWTFAWGLEGAGPGDLTVDAFSTGEIWLTLAAPPGTAAGAYAFTVNVRTQAGPLAAFLFEARVPRTFGLAIVPSSSPVFVGPGQTADVRFRVMNLGNGEEFCAVAASLPAPQVWSLALEYEAVEGGGAVSAGSLTLEPFAQGVLHVRASAPREPSPGNYTVSLALLQGGAVAAAAEGGVVVALADLTVDVEVPRGGVADPVVSLNITVRVQNAGGLDVVTPFQVAAFVDGRVVARLEVEALAAGAGADLSFSVSLPAGDFALVVRVDPADGEGTAGPHGRVFEGDEGNNEATAAVHVAGAAGPGEEPAGPSTTTAAQGGGLLLFVVLALAGGGAVAGLLAWRRRRRRDAF